MIGEYTTEVQMLVDLLNAIEQAPSLADLKVRARIIRAKLK